MRLVSRALLAAMLAVLISSCGEGEAVLQVRNYRKQGDYRTARDLALASLSESQRNLALWRELTFTNLMQARRVDSDQDRFPLVVQSAILCAALRQHKGKLDDKWGAAATMASSQIVSESMRVIDRIDDSGQRLQELQEERLQEGVQQYRSKRQREQVERAYERLFLKSSPPLVDPNEAREIVWRASYLYHLMEQLPLKDANAAEASLQAIDTKLNEWPTYTELEPSFVEDLRQQAVEDCRTALEQVVGDLEQAGHFSLEHTLKLDLRP